MPSAFSTYPIKSTYKHALSKSKVKTKTRFPIFLSITIPSLWSSSSSSEVSYYSTPSPPFLFLPRQKGFRALLISGPSEPLKLLLRRSPMASHWQNHCCPFSICSSSVILRNMGFSLWNILLACGTPECPVFSSKLTDHLFSSSPLASPFCSTSTQCCTPRLNLWPQISSPQMMLLSQFSAGNF